MIRVDCMIGEVLAACIPGTVLCLMVIPPSLSLNCGMERMVANDDIYVFKAESRLARATESMRATPLPSRERAASRS
jgi:hypothetical protein